MKKLIIITTIFLLIVGVISVSLTTTVSAKQVEPESVGMPNNPSKPGGAMKEYKLVGMGAQGMLQAWQQTRQYGLSAYFTNPNDEPITLKNLSVYAENGSVIYDGDFVIFDFSDLEYILKTTILPHETIIMRLQRYEWTGAAGDDDPENPANWKTLEEVLGGDYHMITFEIEWEAKKSAHPLTGYMSQQCIIWDAAAEEWTLPAFYHIPLVNMEQ